MDNVNKVELDGEKIKQIISEMNNESQLDYPSGGGGYVSDCEEFIKIMEGISSNHDDFLKNDIENIAKIFPMSFTDNDIEYSNLLSDYIENQTKINEVDQDGSVAEGESSSTPPSTSYDVPSAGDSFSGYSAPEISGSDYDVGAPTQVPTSDIKSELSSIPSENVKTEASLKPLAQSSGTKARISSPTSDSKATMKSSLAGAAAGGVAGGAAAAVGEAISDSAAAVKSKLDTPSVLEHTDYLLGNYDCSNISESLDEEQSKNVTEVLKECGCSDEEIDAILNGEYSVSQVLVDSVSEELGGLIEGNPGIRQEIIDQYGIDVFNEDGSVNNDKLSLALCIDDLNGKDNYSMIGMLTSNYGVNLVDPDKFSKYSSKMEQLLLSDFSIKEKIKNEYGFDLFNPDGSINTDRLTLAMLIDSKRKDGRSLDNILDDVSISSIGSDLVSNIKGIGVKTPNNGSSGTMKTAGFVLAAAGATAVGGVGVKKALDKKKEEQKENEQIINTGNNQVAEKNESNDDSNSGSGWIYDVINN